LSAVSAAVSETDSFYCDENVNYHEKDPVVSELISGDAREPSWRKGFGTDSEGRTRRGCREGRLNRGGRSRRSCRFHLDTKNSISCQGY